VSGDSDTAIEWRPSASNDVLIKRARLLAQVREFFALRCVLEVDLPVLGERTVSDPVYWQRIVGQFTPSPKLFALVIEGAITIQSLLCWNGIAPAGMKVN